MGMIMIVISGASKGIGRFLFSRFKNEEIKVIGTYHSTKEIPEEDIQFYYEVDVSEYDQVKKWIDSIENQLADIVLINCAGISYNSFAHKADIDCWNKVIDVNLKGSFNVIRCLLPIMRKQYYGRIINFSSIVTQLPTPGVSAYATSKAGLVGLTKSLAAENAMKGITVNSINLGYVNLGMGVNDVPESYQIKMKNQIPAGRFCNPDEVYKTIKYLIDTEYINGTSIDVNGGMI
jgi:acetoacetyl-CoA reductase/3-oxoacyl-[acyl-carrier protein] reductase